MWFLRADTFIGLSLISLVMVLCGRLRSVSDKACMNVLALLCTLFIGWVSWRLLLFYLIYVALIFGISRINPGGKRLKGAVFIAGCLICALPLFFVRLWPARQVIVVIGLAFSVLRGADVMYFVHYTDEKPGFMVLYNYMLFVPALTAGPVFRYRDFKRAAEELKPVNTVDFTRALKRMIRGLFKSIVAAKLIMNVFEHFTKPDAPYTLPVSALLVASSYLILFFDLSGYADIAVAMGRLCGFIVPENFKKPWKAASFTQFWRSWHSTVSDWIREHVYILLHNKRLSKVKSAGIALVVMVVMALWHGFTVPFLTTGLYLGALLAAENLLGLTSPGKKWTPVRALRCLAVNFLFGINTLLFVTDFRTALDIVSGLFRL